MAVYREGFKIIYTLDRRSVLIYPDAIDYGVPVKKGDENWNMAKQLRTQYEGTDRKVEKYLTGQSVEITYTFYDEWAEGPAPKVKFRVSYVTCTDGKCKGYDGYISVTKL